MTIRDRSQEVDKDFRPLYELLDGLASEWGEEPIADVLNFWLRNHTDRHILLRDEFTKADCVKAWKRQNGVCPYCHTALIDPRRNHHVESAEQTTCDHLKPCSEGGRADQVPVACHRRCNSSKGTKNLHGVSKATGMTTLELLERMKLEGATE
jgi:hypothetical protein